MSATTTDKSDKSDKQEFNSKHFNIREMARDAKISEGHVLNAHPDVPRWIWQDYYGNDSEVPNELKDIARILGENCGPEDKPSKRDLLEYLKVIRETHDNSHLMRTCVGKLAEYYKK